MKAAKICFCGALLAFLGWFVWGCDNPHANGQNSFPVIDNITADSMNVYPGGQVHLTCWAHDSDGDPLSYSWLDYTGSLGGYSSPSTVWQAPVAYGQTYGIRCIVSDGMDTAEDTIYIWVGGWNQPPYAPSNPFPADNAYGQPYPALTLSWVGGGDPDVGEVVTFDVYFKSNATPYALIASDISDTFCTVTGLVPQQGYNWQVKAKDNDGHISSSGDWGFRTSSVPQFVEWDVTDDASITAAYPDSSLNGSYLKVGVEAGNYWWMFLDCLPVVALPNYYYCEVDSAFLQLYADTISVGTPFDVYIGILQEYLNENTASWLNTPAMTWYSYSAPTLPVDTSAWITVDVQPYMQTLINDAKMGLALQPLVLSGADHYKQFLSGETANPPHFRVYYHQTI